MQVLVRLMCDCASPSSACPECRAKRNILHWLPTELLTMLQRPYIILNPRYVPSSRADNITTNSTPVLTYAAIN